MTHEKLIESDLPVYFQCLRVPCEVRTAARPTFNFESPTWKLEALLQMNELKAHEPPTRLYCYANDFQADTYDPWEQRGRFFRIKEGDDESLIEFLQSVGLFGFEHGKKSTVLVTDPGGLHHTVRYVSEVSIKYVWSIRRMMENSLSNLKEHTGRLTDFTARIILTKGQPRVTITTCTFLESLLLTLAVDRVEKAKVRKCARPDCRSLFSSSTAHGKKFCCWYCGHIESVRNSRKRAKKTKRARKES